MTTQTAPAVVGDWTHTADYESQYAETTDPRILAVIVRDADPQAPDGDAYAPAYWIEYRNSYQTSPAGFTFQDDASDAIARRYADALERFAYRVTHTPSERTPGFMMPRYEYAPARLQRTDILARWLRIFHDTAAREIDRRGASYGTDGHLLILSTPTFREHVGAGEYAPTRTTTRNEAAHGPAVIDGDADAWTAYMSGEVYGVGYATMPARTTTETPADLTGVTPDGDTWDVTVECWGFYGETYARESAAAFEHGAPNLPAMIDGTAPTLAGVTA